jgi:hypothetical protein
MFHELLLRDHEGRPYPWSQQVIHEIFGLNQREIELNRALSKILHRAPFSFGMELDNFEFRIADFGFDEDKLTAAIRD